MLWFFESFFPAVWIAFLLYWQIKAAGTKTCAVTYGFGMRQALLQCAPDHVIENFRELVDLVRELQS